MKFHVIVNPGGASGRTGKLWHRAEKVFAASGRPYEVHYSTRERGIAAICRELEQTVCDQNEETELCCIVTVGGDGSVNEAVNGLQHPGRVLFAHIPAGSGNDLVRDIELPGRIEDIAARILEGKVRRTCDIGELRYADTGEIRRFAVSCGIGFDAGICEKVSRSPFKPVLNRIGLGKLIYIMAAFTVIHGQHCGWAELILEGPEGRQTVRYDRLLLLAGMNHQYEGGGFRFTPEADPDDGILNLCTADPAHNRAFYRAFPLVPMGRYFNLPYLHELRGARIEIRTSEPMWVHTDGEVTRKADHVHLRCMDEKLRLLE